MILNDLQVKVINNFLNLWVTELANKYLNKIKYHFKKNEVDEIVLKYLDNSVYLSVEKIDIKNNKRNKSIKKMNSKELIKFKKATEKQNSYSKMFKELSYIYAIIKEEELQINLFNMLYNSYNKNEEKINEKDIYKKISIELLTKNQNLFNFQDSDFNNIMPSIDDIKNTVINVFKEY